MATKATGWLATHTASIVSQTDTTATIRVTAIWENSGWRYDINYVNAWVYCNGVSKQVATNGSVDTTSDYDSETLGYYDFVVDKGTAAKSISCYAKITSNSSYVSGTKTSTATSVTVAAKQSYTISYHANGGGGAPSPQTKWDGASITLSSTKPVRTGYTFVKWNTKSDGTGTSYNPGATYSADASVTLYAIWQVETYPVTYDANGGTGAPASQTKTFEVDLYLHSTQPTREGYLFAGWSTSQNGGVVYSVGALYDKNSPLTLYAVWVIGYRKPRITSFKADRCSQDGTRNESGTYVRSSFLWSCDHAVTNINLDWKEVTGSWDNCSTYNIALTGTEGVADVIVGNGLIDIDTSYLFRARVTDSGGTTYSLELPIGTIKFPIDVKAGGTGVAIGKAAEKDIFDVAMDMEIQGHNVQYSDTIQMMMASETVNIPTAWTMVKIPLNSAAKTGTAFTFDSTNKQAVVNFDGYVDAYIQFNVYANSSYIAGDYNVMVYKNNGYCGSGPYEYVKTSDVYRKLIGQVFSIPCVAGDRFDLRLNASAAGNIKTFAYETCSLTLKYRRH